MPSSTEQYLNATHCPNLVVSWHGHFGQLANCRGSTFCGSCFLDTVVWSWEVCATSPGLLANRRPRVAAQGTQDHRISIIHGGSSSRTHLVQPVSLPGMTRTLGCFGQCALRMGYCWYCCFIIILLQSIHFNQGMWLLVLLSLLYISDQGTRIFVSWISCI